MKNFSASFQSLGDGACMFVDFKDGNQRTYGDQYFCSLWKSGIQFEPGMPIKNPFLFNHTY